MALDFRPGLPTLGELRKRHRLGGSGRLNGLDSGEGFWRSGSLERLDVVQKETVGSSGNTFPAKSLGTGYGRVSSA